jgi:Cys-tRNA(Pro) deacylase
MATTHPVTMAIRAMRKHEVVFVAHVFAYVDHGGTSHSAATLGVDEHAVVKTLIFEDDQKRPLCVLMHGDREVSTRALARRIGARSVEACAVSVAERHSGYQVGGTSPFGLRKSMPVYVEHSILALTKIYINGGARGFLVEIDPGELSRVLAAVPVEVAVIEAR